MDVYGLNVHAGVVFLQNVGIPGLMMRFLHIKEQLDMEVLIYEI